MLSPGDYYGLLSKRSEEVFAENIAQGGSYGKIHEIASELMEWGKVTTPGEVTCLLHNACESIDLACLMALHGYYRQAMYGLRLSMEQCFGFLYFSQSEYKFREWQYGIGDLRWSEINNSESGVFGVDVVRVFFAEEHSLPLEEFRSAIGGLYRECSEFVHGNNVTWLDHPEKIKASKEEMTKFYNAALKFQKYLHIGFCIRFIRFIPHAKLKDLELNVNPVLTLSDFRRYFSPSIS